MNQPINIKQKASKPKRYGKSRDLSLKATGMLYHILCYLNSDGNYSWGNVKTAEHFGVHYNRIADVLDELQDQGYIIDIQSGRDSKTGKHRLRIVRPTAKVRKPRTPVCVDEKSPDMLARMAAHVETKANSAADAQDLAPDPPSMHACERLSVITSSSGNESVSMRCNHVGTEDGMHARVHGAADINKVQAALAEEQSELQFWLATKNTKNIEACRQRIAELQAQLTGAQ